MKLVWAALGCWLAAIVSIFTLGNRAGLVIQVLAALTLILATLLVIKKLSTGGDVSTRLLAFMGSVAVVFVFCSIQLTGQTAARVASNYQVLDVQFEVQEVLATSQNHFAGPPNRNARICIKRWGIGAQAKAGSGCGTLSVALNATVQPGLVAAGRLAFKPARNVTDGFFRARVDSGTINPIRQNLSLYVFGGFKEQFSRAVSGVSPDAVALVLGLGIGDDSGLSPATAEQMKSLSLTHLTAVSGANCAIVLGGVFYLSLFLGVKRWPRFVLATVSLCCYVLLVGQQPSVLRAGVMALVVLLAMTLGRGVSPISALALTVSGLLISNPLLAVQYGFALSVAATAGLLILAPNMAKAFERR